MKSEQLLTQGKIFENDILAGPEFTNNPAEEVPEPYDHAQNLTGTLPIELGAKSLILRVYDVLMTHTHLNSQLVASTDLRARFEREAKSSRSSSMRTSACCTTSATMMGPTSW